jgi:hypothetical protein
MSLRSHLRSFGPRFSRRLHYPGRTTTSFPHPSQNLPFHSSSCATSPTSIKVLNSQCITVSRQPAQFDVILACSYPRSPHMALTLLQINSSQPCRQATARLSSPYPCRRATESPSTCISRLVPPMLGLDSTSNPRVWRQNDALLRNAIASSRSLRERLGCFDRTVCTFRRFCLRISEGFVQFIMLQPHNPCSFGVILSQPFSSWPKHPIMIRSSIVLLLSVVDFMVSSSLRPLPSPWGDHGAFFVSISVHPPPLPTWG